MNKAKFSVIGHRHLSLCSPLSSAKIDQAIALLDLNPDSKVADFGAGKCELLIRLIEKYGIIGVGVELEGGVISAVEEVVRGRIPRERLQIHLGDAREYVIHQLKTPLDVGICVGSSHALGG